MSLLHVVRGRRRLAVLVATAIVATFVPLPAPEAFASTPPTVATLTQTDQTTAAIPSGGVTNSTTITFGADVTDVDNDDVTLSVEVIPQGDPFTDSATDSESTPSAPGTHSLNVTLPPGSYHWQAMATDVNTDESPWANGDTFRINTPPASPTALAQTSDGNVTIPDGGVTNDTTPTFAGTVTDPDNTPTQTDTLQLEVEVKLASGSFDGSSTHLSSSVADAQTGSVTWPALSPGNYKWRARTVDQNGAVSGWATFGTLSINFRVNAKPNVPASLTQVNASSVAIANNGITNDTTVTLGTTSSDPDADLVLLQVEVRPSTVAFSDSATSSTSLGAQGVQTKAVTPGYGTWHWQARTVDQYGAASATGGRIHLPDQHTAC